MNIKYSAFFNMCLSVLTRFSKENKYDQSGGYAGDWLSKEYTYCTENVFNSFQHMKLYCLRYSI